MDVSHDTLLAAGTDRRRILAKHGLLITKSVVIADSRRQIGLIPDKIGAVNDWIGVIADMIGTIQAWIGLFPGLLG